MTDWQDISTAPRDFTPFIGYDQFDGVYPCMGKMSDREPFVNLTWVDGVGDWQEAHPTHWMPLPPAPTVLESE